MKIELSQKDYKILLKHAAIGDWVYGIMSDAVSARYKQEADDSDELIHKLLKYCDDENIKTVFDGKNIFTDKYGEKIADDMIEYEDYIVEDLTGVNIKEIDREINEEIDTGIESIIGDL